MSNDVHNKGKRIGVIFTSILAVIIIVILSLYFFTDILTAKEGHDESSGNNNELVENNNDSNDQLDESNETVINSTKPENETVNNAGDTTPSNENESVQHDNQEEPLKLEPLSDKIIDALANRDMVTIANYVDPEKGLLFSPYIFVTDDAVVFEKAEVGTMLDQSDTYDWGDYDGKGTPIELTPAEYFDEFLEIEPFKNNDEVLIDDLQDRGNTLNNIDDVFPNARVIEYYNDGTEEYAGIDWESILLVYKEDDTGALSLIAIIRDMWTI